MNRNLTAPIALLALLTALSAVPKTLPQTNAKANSPAQGKKALKRTATKPVATLLAPLALPAADAEQTDAAALVLMGDYVCEFDHSLRVRPAAQFPGYIDVQFDKEMFTTKPLLSTTGVLRLEDVRGRVLLLQIPVKSMLMDVQVGRRLVDDCVTQKQAENRVALAAAPAEPGLGIASINTDAVLAASAGASAADATPPIAQTAASSPMAVAAPASDPIPAANPTPAAAAASSAASEPMAASAPAVTSATEAASTPVAASAPAPASAPAGAGVGLR